MRPGDKLRFRGPAGAPFVVTVSEAWTEQTIKARLAAGEWTSVDEDGEPQQTEQDPASRPPAGNAPKAEWVAYAVDVLGHERAAAEDMTVKRLKELAETGASPGEEPARKPTAETADPGRPADSAPKAEWMAYAVRKGLFSREDAANYTRDDLIAMTS